MSSHEEKNVRILVATDGSKAGNAAVRFAAKLATANPRNRLIVLTVDADAAASGNGSARSPHAHPAHPEAGKVLAGAARQLRGRRARFQRVPARADQVPETISREADRVKADLVVIGSEGRDSLQEWVIGGTALRLIYVARRPVTVVRAPRRRAVS
jgi:nucleotide-binding universal stress UspA family protein